MQQAHGQDIVDFCKKKTNSIQDERGAQIRQQLLVLSTRDIFCSSFDIHVWKKNDCPYTQQSIVTML